MDHGQQHPELLPCMDGVGFVCRYYDHPASGEHVLVLYDSDLCFAIDHRDDCTEGCGLFRQFFAGINGLLIHAFPVFSRIVTISGGSTPEGHVMFSPTSCVLSESPHIYIIIHLSDSTLWQKFWRP